MKTEQQIYAELLFQKICAKGLLLLYEGYYIVDISNNPQTPQLPNDHYTAVSFPTEYYSTPSTMAYPNSDSSTKSIIKSLPINLKKKLKPAAHDAFFSASSCMGSCDGNIDGFGD
uniref:Uncharacterized protein n=1 Tax=Sipha flava TaxID=143950 RepID=A0A2S2R0Y1_9HEMI